MNSAAINRIYKKSRPVFTGRLLFFLWLSLRQPLFLLLHAFVVAHENRGYLSACGSALGLKYAISDTGDEALGNGPLHLIECPAGYLFGISICCKLSAQLHIVALEGSVAVEHGNHLFSCKRAQRSKQIVGNAINNLVLLCPDNCIGAPNISLDILEAAAAADGSSMEVSDVQLVKVLAPSAIRPSGSLTSARFVQPLNIFAPNSILVVESS